MNSTSKSNQRAKWGTLSTNWKNCGRVFHAKNAQTHTNFKYSRYSPFSNIFLLSLRFIFIKFHKCVVPPLGSLKFKVRKLAVFCASLPPFSPVLFKANLSCHNSNCVNGRIKLFSSRKLFNLFFHNYFIFVK